MNNSFLPFVIKNNHEINNLSKGVSEYEWTATDGQLTYVLPSDQIYDVNSKWLEVFVGGAPIPDSQIQKDNSSQFTLLIDSTKIKAGMNVFARWTQPYIPSTSGHNVTHQLGGTDEIDITKLKNFNEQVATPLAQKATLNGTVQITTFADFPTAVTYCINNNKILDLCATTVTASASWNGMQLCSIRNGMIILNDYVTFNVADNTLIEDVTIIDNYVYSKTTNVPANFDQVSIGWVIDSLNGSSNNVTFRRVQSYSQNSLVTSTYDGTYRTRGFMRIKGNNIVVDSCTLKDSRNAIRMGINSTNAPQWTNFVIRNCHFENVEQCIDLLNVQRVLVDKCSLLNTATQQSNYSVLMGADFICGISSNDIHVSNILVERPVERTAYIINAKRFHLNGFTISYGGNGQGGGLKIAGWGSGSTTSTMSQDCIIENGYCGVTANEFFDLYGVDGVTIRNISTAVSGSPILVEMTNTCRRVHLENIRASITAAMIYAYASTNNLVTTNDNGLEVTNLVIKDCTMNIMQNSTNYVITAHDATGGTAAYATFDSWTIINSVFNLDSSITSTKFLLSQDTFGTITNIKINNIMTNSNYLSLYDFPTLATIQHWANVELTGKAKTNNYMYGLDMPNIISYFPSGTYSLDLYSSNVQYGNLTRENNGNLVYKRTFNATGTEYILRRVTSGKTLNFTVLFEIDSTTFSNKFVLSSNGSALTSTALYGTITNNTTNIALPNGDQLQLDGASFPSSLRYSATTTNPINVKMTILSVSYV